MSLSNLMKTGLPLNRKERYFTGTVFPMIVCSNNFKDLSVLASLIPGCKLPPVDPNPQTANIQFFTEYSFVESVHGPETKGRFPNPPADKFTPDIMILVKGQTTVLVAIEAKMFDRPSKKKLVDQLSAQHGQLEYLKKHIPLHSYIHAALLPKKLAQPLGGEISIDKGVSVPVVHWEALLAAYRPVRGEADYFMGILELALLGWDGFCSPKSTFGANAEGLRTGAEIVRDFGKDPSLQIMGRRSGLNGVLLGADIASGNWRDHPYEVSSASDALPRKNWFPIEDFARLVKLAQRGQLQTMTAGPGGHESAQVASPTLSGEQIVSSVGNPAVRTMGRRGGLLGKELAGDIHNGSWKWHRYRISSLAEPQNKNWFTVEEFTALVQEK